MNIDETAPAVARDQIEIAAPQATVWRILSDVAAWPSWNPDVKSASIEGPLLAGTRFRWKSGPGTISSTLQRVDPPSLMAWTGTTLGIKAVHVYRLEERGETTVVTSEESWDGRLVRVLRRAMTRSLRKSLESGLQHLRAEAERRALSEPREPPTPGQSH